MAAPIDFDEGQQFQPVMWRLTPDEQLMAIYTDAGALENGINSYIAITDKRVLIPDWEFLFKDITYVKIGGSQLELTLQTLEGNVTLEFLGESQTNYAYRCIMILSGLKYQIPRGGNV